MKKTLTHAVVGGLKAPAVGQIDVWDSRRSRALACAYRRAVLRLGWCVTVSVGGARAMCSANIRKMGLADARQAARRYLGEVAKGDDPAQVRRDEKAAGTFADLADEYMKRRAANNRLRSRQEYERMLRKDCCPRGVRGV